MTVHDFITAPAVVVGGGIAGLSTALSLEGCVVASGAPLGDGASRLAQGGIAAALGPACEVWPAMDIAALADRFGAAHGVIGVDSGPSHNAVALDLPPVLSCNFPTSWRTGPQAAHGHLHQVSVVGQPTPGVDTVWQAWRNAWTQYRQTGSR